MKNDFKNLEEDMELLLSKMDEITKSSETITSTLHASDHFHRKIYILSMRKISKTRILTYVFYMTFRPIEMKY